jgi:hypothetical protein
MKLQMKREALEKLRRRANEMSAEKGDRIRTVSVQRARYWHGLARSRPESWFGVVIKLESALESIVLVMSGRSAAW